MFFQPLENFRVGRNEITGGTVSPSYILPLHGLQRLEKNEEWDPFKYVKKIWVKFFGCNDSIHET